MQFVSVFTQKLKTPQPLEQKLAVVRLLSEEYKRSYADTNVQISHKKLAFGPIITFSFESVHGGNMIGFISSQKAEEEWICNIHYQPPQTPHPQNPIYTANQEPIVEENRAPAPAASLVSEQNQERLAQLTRPLGVTHAPRQRCAECYQYH